MTILPPGQKPDCLISALEIAIIQAVSYADVFDYPLTIDEIHRFTSNVKADPNEIRSLITNSSAIMQFIEKHDEFYSLRGRGLTVEIRHRRGKNASRLWPRAIQYGNMIARLPYVRMVAVTGALSVDNVDPHDDIDYLIVTQTGRLWLCRAFVILLVRLARLLGDRLCPNYFLSDRTLHLREHSLYSAHEFVQMVPLAGRETFQEMQVQNPWVATFLPNVNGDLVRNEMSPVTGYRLKEMLETVLSTSAGEWLERWEMRRKIRKFSGRKQADTAGTEEPLEAQFSADCCKGHFDAHAARVFQEYHMRLSQMPDGRIGQ